MRLMADQRREFLIEHPRCWYCCRMSECVHEMARGAHRQRAIQEPCTWFAACSLCNSGPLNDWGAVPLLEQLQIKKCNDPSRFDIERFNEIRGRAPGAITLQEVEEWQ